MNKMKKDNRKNKNILSKAMLVFGAGSVVAKLISRGRIICKEQQGDLSADFPEIKNEINEAVEAALCEREESANE